MAPKPSRASLTGLTMSHDLCECMPDINRHYQVFEICHKCKTVFSKVLPDQQLVSVDVSFIKGFYLSFSEWIYRRQGSAIKVTWDDYRNLKEIEKFME